MSHVLSHWLPVFSAFNSLNNGASLAGDWRLPPLEMTHNIVHSHVITLTSIKATQKNNSKTAIMLFYGHLKKINK